MADVRALLRAKRQEARVQHPYASYTTSGQLRCTVCGMTIKQASMWEGHIGSKSHRVNVIKLREIEAQREEDSARRELEEEAQQIQGKRKVDEDSERDRKKRRLSDGKDGNDQLPSVSTTTKESTGGFPADFFSDASRAPQPTEDEDEDEDDTLTDPAPIAKSELDLEWERFQATVINAPETEKEEDRKDTYERATVFADPELASQVPEGFPPQVDNIEDVSKAEEPTKEETEDEKQKRKEQEERELIMDRLIEEERAQEEADSRVGLLRTRLEALKKTREARKEKRVKDRRQ